MDKTTPGYEILLVDDDEDDYLIIRDMLDPVERHRFYIQWAKNSQEAHRWLATKTWDAVLMDYDLGEGTGTQIIREAVANGSKAPFIMVTGRGNYEKDVEAMQAGAADYLSKIDLSAPLLERTIRYAIDRKRVEEDLEQRVQARTEELQVTIEELQVAEEDLRIQVEQLHENQSGGEDQARHFQALFEFAPSGYLVMELSRTASKASCLRRPVHCVSDSGYKGKYHRHPLADQ